MCKKIIVSEFVSSGHPDKIADVISDKLLDSYLLVDEDTRAGIEVMVKDNVVVIGGEVTSSATIDYDTIIRRIFDKYNFPSSHHLSGKDIKIISLIGKQSTEIHSGVDKSATEIGAGDQGFVVGFASNDTDTYMPLGHYLAKKICQYISSQREYELGPDTKTQVIIERDTITNENSVKSILVSTMHQCDLETCRDFVKKSIIFNNVGIDNDLFIKYIADNDIKIDVNPCGSWQMGGPVSDCGVTGRKLVVDQYGGYCNIGGGNLSGKDYSKVDRSAAYMARYLSKNIVAAKIANTAKVEISYMIGVCEPCSVNIELDTNNDKVEEIKEWIKKNVDLTPYGIMQRFSYWYPRNARVQTIGYYGYNVDNDEHMSILFPWEKLDLVKDLYETFNN